MFYPGECAARCLTYYSVGLQRRNTICTVQLRPNTMNKNAFTTSLLQAPIKQTDTLFSLPNACRSCRNNATNLVRLWVSVTGFFPMRVQTKVERECPSPDSAICSEKDVQEAAAATRGPRSQNNSHSALRGAERAGAGRSSSEKIGTVSAARGPSAGWPESHGATDGGGRSVEM